MRKEWRGTVHYKDFYNFRTTSSAYNVPKTFAQTQSFHPTNITQPRTDTRAQDEGYTDSHKYLPTHMHTQAKREMTAFIWLKMHVEFLKKQQAELQHDAQI